MYLKLSRAPQRLRQEITPEDKIVIINEIQKLPLLLDEVHHMIEKKGIHFLLSKIPELLSQQHFKSINK